MATISQIPSFRATIENYLFQIKGLLKANNCESALTHGFKRVAPLICSEQNGGEKIPPVAAEAVVVMMVKGVTLEGDAVVVFAFAHRNRPSRSSCDCSSWCNSNWCRRCSTHRSLFTIFNIMANQLQLFTYLFIHPATY
uniref:Uncharacterized protein n=1 Tax=Glossina brevipalpis TaxID=37001 RepID=A0A1A9WDI1_9MUSC